MSGICKAVPALVCALSLCALSFAESPRRHVSLSKPSLSPLTVDGALFRDETGAAILLRGLNVSGGKTPPFTKLNAADLAWLPKWGINTIRLVFIWEAYEPEIGKYNQEYLRWYVGLVKSAGRLGLRVIVDFHQDAFSRYVLNGCGAGFPKWAVSKGYPPNKPDNGVKCANWGVGQLFSDGVRHSFSDFYRGKGPARGHWLKVWRKISSSFKDNPAVIGYDLLNEPIGGWNQEILPLYEMAAKQIRATSDKKLLFLEPPLGRLMTDPSTMNRPSFRGAVFAPHFYSLSVLVRGGWSPRNDLTAPELKVLRDLASRWNMPLFLGEFGGNMSSYLHDYLEAMYAEFNKDFVSVAQWSYLPSWTPLGLDGWNREDSSITDDRGKLRESFRVRPYAERVAGTPITMIEERSQNDPSFSLRWKHSPAAGETILFAPRRGDFAIFPTGSFIKVSSSDLTCEYGSDGIRIHCSSPKEGIYEVTVTGSHDLAVVGKSARTLSRRE